jgi:GNAT superfamily N-acetyltransferase
MDIRVVEPARDDPVARALLALQRRAYEVEAAVIGDDRIPVLGESLDQLRRAPLSWLGAFHGLDLVGAVAWADAAGTGTGLDIDRLVVDPDRHRRGVGRALVSAVLARAGGRRVTVSTGRANLPARTLYESLGFTPTGDREPVPGLWVTGYAHPGSRVEPA